MEIRIDGGRELVADLDRAQSQALPEVRAVVAKGATNIKQDWAKRWSGLSHAPRLPAAISWDPTTGPGTVGAEIGPDKSRAQGALGNLIEFGSVHNAPRPGGLPALAAEQPRFEQALEDLSERLLGG